MYYLYSVEFDNTNRQVYSKVSSSPRFSELMLGAIHRGWADHSDVLSKSWDNFSNKFCTISSNPNLDRRQDPVVVFRGKVLELEVSLYPDTYAIALSLITYENGYPEPYATPSRNFPELKPREIAIADYSENDGMVKAFQNAGLIGESISVIASGFVEIEVFKWRGPHPEVL